jgi:hypothetical protein
MTDAILELEGGSSGLDSRPESAAPSARFHSCCSSAVAGAPGRLPGTAVAAAEAVAMSIWHEGSGANPPGHGRSSSAGASRRLVPSLQVRPVESSQSRQDELAMAVGDVGCGAGAEAAEADGGVAAVVGSGPALEHTAPIHDGAARCQEEERRTMSSELKLV